MPTIEELHQDILTKGYHEVAFPLSRQTIEEAVCAFFAFLALPLETKLPWGAHLKANERDRGTELGYHRRQSEAGTGHDNKEFFHYNTEAYRRFHTPDAPIELKEFLEKADVVYRAAAQTIKPFIDIIQSVYPNIADPFCNYSILRFLKYDRTEKGGSFLARGHYDRGGGSLAIAESAPGLRIGHTPNDVKEVAYQEGRALLFPALFMQERTNGDFPASWHDVVQKPEATFTADTARWAVVFFAAPDEASYWFRHLTHNDPSLKETESRKIYP